MENEERFNGLENQVRTLKRIVCLVCCLFMVSCCASSTKNISPEEIELMDPNRRVYPGEGQVDDGWAPVDPTVFK